MEITAKELRNIVKTFLDLLDEENIEKTGDLEKKVGKKILFEKLKDNYMSFELKPSDLGTNAYTIRYNVPGEGIPLELKLNTELNYSKIILKSKEGIKGYKTFSLDNSNNLIQKREILSSEFAYAKGGLKELLAFLDEKIKIMS